MRNKLKPLKKNDIRDDEQVYIITFSDGDTMRGYVQSDETIDDVLRNIPFTHPVTNYEREY